MERSRLLVTVRAEHGLRQATVSLIMTLGRKDNPSTPILMRITTGGLEVYQSGHVQSYGDKPIEIELIDEGDPLKIEVSVSRIKDAKKEIKLNPESSQLLKVEFINPSLNYGFSPSKIGTMKGRELYISFRASTMGEGESFVLYYGFYLGKEVSGG